MILSKQLRRLGLDSNPGWPHFLGTIDSFKNQELFLHYALLAPGDELFSPTGSRTSE